MKHLKDKSRIRDQKRKKRFNGEASPYHNWLEVKGDYGQNHEALEPATANPDVLMESDGMYYWKADIDDDQMDVVKAAIPLLTEKQRQVLLYVGLEGKTLENCGAVMGISRGNVLDLLNRARKTIKDQAKKKSKGEINGNISN